MVPWTSPTAALSVTTTGILPYVPGGGSAVGGAMILLGSLNQAGYCEEDDEDCKKTEKQASGMTTAGVILTGVSLGVGIPLIVSGKHKRNEWKKWQVGVTHVSQGNAAFFTYNFD